MSTVLAWSPDDQLAAVTSVADETESCSGCGLRPDQFPHVAVALDRCPGCEARERIRKTIADGDVGIRTVFELVDDARDSIWARYTHQGSQWARTHRADAGVLTVADPDNPAG